MFPSNRLCRVAVAAVVAFLASASSAPAADPLGGFRYEPYASVSSNSAVQVGQTVFMTENSSFNATAAYYYAVVANQYIQFCYYDLYPNYGMNLGVTVATYRQYCSIAANAAYQANLFAYQAYLENKTPNSQAFSGWCYYTNAYTYGMTNQGPPPQDLAPTFAHAAGYYLRARLYGFHLPFATSFLNQHAQLDAAAQHHAEFMATADAVSEVEGTDDSLGIIQKNSTFNPDPNVVVLTLNMQTDNLSFLARAFGQAVFAVNLGSTHIGVGASTSNTNKVYYCVYVTKQL